MKTQPIFDWETNYVYITDKLKEYFPKYYERLIEKFSELGINYDVLQGSKDFWCRDYMPIQVGNKILVSSFGLLCESFFMKQIQSYYSDCILYAIEMREIADCGGALHCIT